MNLRDACLALRISDLNLQGAWILACLLVRVLFVKVLLLSRLGVIVTTAPT